MLATFVLMEPVWVAVAFVALVALTTHYRAARRLAPRAVAAGTEERAADAPAPAAAASTSRRTRLGASSWVLAASAMALALAALLVAAKTATAHVLLLLAGVVAVTALSVQSYRHRQARLSSGRAAACILARVIAWLVVLVMIGRPVWRWVLVEWEKPLLTVLLDQSKSMSITDGQSAGQPSRAQLVNRAVARARPWIDRLDGLYEMRMFAVAEGQEPLDGWQIAPRASISPIAATLRRAGQSRSLHGEPPVAVLLISDGAENAANPRVVSDVATELAAQRTALLAVGVGPTAGLSPAVVLDPLVVPARIGSRDRLRVPVVAHTTGCEGHDVHLAVLWGDEVADERQVHVDRSTQRLATEFELLPPGVGLHRLTARATLPAELGGEPFETSIIVDVGDDRIRVLVLEGQPRNESAFAVRALRGQPRFDVTQRLLLAESQVGRALPDILESAGASASPPRWSGYDVVILGAVPGKRLGFSTLAELADAVRERGVGLLMVGGRDFYHTGYYSRSDLQDVSPVNFTLSPPPDDYRPRFRPTEIGRRHPVLLVPGAGAAPVGGGSEAPDVWDKLAPLGGAARFGRPKPLAAILATDLSRRPLLAALDVGRGRCITAAWDSTWPWALSSDEGLAVHRRLWRQLATWLANRRPVAWIVVDRSSYVRAALSSGQQRLQIRAGVSGLATLAEHLRSEEFKASLQLRRVQAGGVAVSQPTTYPARETWEIPLKRRGNEWRADLPQDLHTQAWLAAGVYELTFVVEQTAAGRSPQAAASPRVAAGERLILSARTRFAVTATDLELLEPTANLVALREAAARTGSVGGGYYGIDELSEALRRLAGADRRRRVERPAAYDLTGRQPWLLLLVVASALALEWIVRKRGGLA